VVAALVEEHRPSRVSRVIDVARASSGLYS
jgi:hypothetical protein